MIKKNFLQQIFGVIILSSFLAVTFTSAADLTSTSFIIRDPLVGTGGSYGTSTSFSAFGSGDMTNIGRSTSASFEGREGFLWFPYVIQGVFSAVANGPDADLTWGASTAGLGWSVSDYKTGIKPAGGAYTYTSRGLVTCYSYAVLTPGDYCFRLQTIDALGYVIATSDEDCITITPVITFSISASSLQFGTLSTVGPRYATTGGGSGSDTTGHTMSASSNAPSGYTISYFGPTLTSGSNTIAVASSVSGDGSAGTAQFGLSLGTTGSATIPAAYQQSGPTRTFVANTVTTIATTSAPSASETFDNHYLSNISNTTAAGSYSTDITYVITGNF